MTKIIGVGSHLPFNEYTNEDLASMVHGVDAEWTRRNLNIEKRHIHGTIITDFHEATFPVEIMAAYAAERAIESAEIDKETIGAVIIGTTTQQECSPSAAVLVSEMIGCYDAVAFDVSAACAGFGYSLIIANTMIDTGITETALVIGADAYSRITDWTDRNCVFFGDGAGAVVLTRGNSILSSCMGAASKYWAAWFVKDGTWHMDGKAVFKLAVEGIYRAVTDALTIAKLSVDDVDILIPHQPGIRVLEEAADRLNLPFEKVHTVMDKYANTAAASVPITLDDALKNGKIEKGDLVVLATVGAGWTWAATILRWV